MVVRTLQALILGGVVMASAGCTQPRRANPVSTQPVSIVEPSEDADRLWTAIEETLREHSYKLDRVDRRAGVVTTMPVMSKHFFEIWRQDVKSWHDIWESTVNPIRRWVEVTLTGEIDRGWSEIAVAVHKERLSSLDRQFNSTGAAYQYFSDKLPSTTGLLRVTERDDQWLDWGRDPAMEDHLLRTILARADADPEIE